MTRAGAVLCVTLLPMTGCSEESKAGGEPRDAAEFTDAAEETADSAPGGRDGGASRDAGLDAREDGHTEATEEASDPCAVCASGNCADGACAPAVFVTSTTYTGAIGSGGVDSADAECASLASAAGLPGVFKAWLSAPAPVDRFVQSSHPYYRLDGALVATNFAALAGLLENPISITEQRVDIGFSYVWTATNLDGTANGENCAGWTSAAATSSGEAGESDDAVSEWTAFGTISCDTAARLYCFEQLP